MGEGYKTLPGDGRQSSKPSIDQGLEDTQCVKKACQMTLELLIDFSCAERNLALQRTKPHCGSQTETDIGAEVDTSFLKVHTQSRFHVPLPGLVAHSSTTNDDFHTN